MTDRELLQQALDALELTGVEYLTSKEIEHLDALEIALRARLTQPDSTQEQWEGAAYRALDQVKELQRLLHEEQPEPEPVAWRRSNWSGSDDDYVYRDYDDPLLNTKGENVGEPLYTAPPKLEWVGLTDAERADCSAEAYGRHFVLCELIEAKLKEKNT